jgi:hypothetical protein
MEWSGTNIKREHKNVIYSQKSWNKCNADAIFSLCLCITCIMKWYSRSVENLKNIKHKKWGKFNTRKGTVLNKIWRFILKGQCHEIFDLRVFFSSNNTPWAPDSRLKTLWILLGIRRDMIDFRTQKSCIWCQGHRMH